MTILFVDTDGQFVGCRLAKLPAVGNKVAIGPRGFGRIAGLVETVICYQTPVGPFGIEARVILA